MARYSVLLFAFVLAMGLRVYGQDSVSASNQKRIEDLRARVTRMSNESTDSLILMLRQVIQQQRDSLKSLAGVVDHYEEGATQFSYSASCDCNRVYYGLEKYEANYSSYLVLDSLASLLKTNSAMRLKLVGHTDNTGTLQINQALALKRAENLKAYLVRRYDLVPDLIISEGRGSDENIEGLSDPYLFHLNRRVDIFLLK